MSNEIDKYKFIYFILATTLFGIIPNTFINYGWDYYQFLPVYWFAFPVILTLVLFFIQKIKTIPAICIYICAIILPICFILFRTQIHAFGGDVNFNPMLSPEFTLSDLRFDIHRIRIDNALTDICEKCCRNLNVYKHTDLVPSVLASTIYSIFFGFIFVFYSAIALRKRLDLFLIIATAPFIFNFFGNTDSYAFTLCMTFTFFIACMKVWNMQTLKFWNIALLGILWLCLSALHPLQLFGGFPMAMLFTRYLKQFERFKNIPSMLFASIYAILFFIAVKSSRDFGNTWFYADYSNRDLTPIFSATTFTHWLNMMFLPIIPIAILVYQLDKDEFKQNMSLFGLKSIVFFALGFTLGSDDQFNYQQLFFYFLIPWLLSLSKRTMNMKHAFMVVVCHLSLLVPMIGVNASTANIERAETLYPLDECRHNKIMSWQTHLALIFSDNFQNDERIHAAVLRVFDNGAKHAMPEYFRPGNLIYQTAFMYQYGRFTQGKRQLYELLESMPNSISYFLSPRPSFIVCNRKILWNDIGLFLKEHDSPDFEKYCMIVDQLIKYNDEHPYLDHLPVWAITD